MKNNIFHLTLTTLLLTTYVSCGGSGYGSDDDDSDSSPSPEEQTQDGVFRGVANAVNPDVTFSTGATAITILNNEFSIEIFGSGPADTPHAQYLHEGTRCPTSDDDTNNDGVIDATEGSAVYGARVVTFDSDLTEVSGEFPSDPQYRYSENAVLTELLASLGIPELEVAGKVITIQGVPDSTELPATTQGARSEFPIACGILQRVDE